MEKSILVSIKKLLGIAEDYTQFDTDIIVHINTAFMSLHQLGVHDDEAFTITDKKTKWDDYIDEDDNLEATKTYIYLKVKQVFDPPQSAAALEALQNTIQQLEWRLTVQTDINNGGEQ